MHKPDDGYEVSDEFERMKAKKDAMVARQESTAIRSLRVALADATEKCEASEAVAASLQSVIAGVRELHSAARDGWCSTCNAKWPCLTVQAIGEKR